MDDSDDDDEHVVATPSKVPVEETEAVGLRIQKERDLWRRTKMQQKVLSKVRRKIGRIERKGAFRGLREKWIRTTMERGRHV